MNKLVTVKEFCQRMGFDDFRGISEHIENGGLSKCVVRTVRIDVDRFEKHYGNPRTRTGAAKRMMTISEVAAAIDAPRRLVLGWIRSGRFNADLGLAAGARRPKIDFYKFMARFGR